MKLLRDGDLDLLWKRLLGNKNRVCDRGAGGIVQSLSAPGKQRERVGLGAVSLEQNTGIYGLEARKLMGFFEKGVGV